ncbi:hypothetical protein IQ260_07170 [Leptolyngbya cf. ectocarpi LEGE 11479]|uniref:Uncharacterized protein n=1 Tax=Leptolyngbya cf. ectocarpi LEGE 11479 TaxID=1828722 RepID=A0A928ZQN8_LEPEC|nr:hypothetical protein [Leptolyngbya ectocarpi]MBE9066430.1 hypothetical protein [Leptolyngbya cf. ectocarpi LEGE 11479]
MELIGKAWITQDIKLWSALALTVLLMLTILMVASRFHLPLLDRISSPNKARDKIEEMDARQRKAHVWITATLDVALPLSYGYLFAGTALRFFPKYGAYLILPALLAILVDLTEGGIQILALTSVADLLELKKYVTPLKFGLVVLGGTIAIAGLAKGICSNFGFFP